MCVIDCKYPRLRFVDFKGNAHFIDRPTDSEVFDIINGSTRFDWIPCGKCLACRINRSQDWECRLMMESVTRGNGLFLTLTYDDEHLFHLLRDGYDTKGRPRTSATLCVKHCQDFVKRLRKHFLGADIRYLLCGEYGENSSRPHYHLAVFGLNLDDLVSYKRSGDFELFTSETLNKIWSHGFCVIGTLTNYSAGYIAKYILKKQYGVQGNKYYSDLGIIPEFILSSKRPALGTEFLLENAEKIARKGYLIFPTLDGYKRYPIPRYIKDKILMLYPEYEHYFGERLDRDQDKSYWLNAFNLEQDRDIVTQREQSYASFFEKNEFLHERNNFT